MPDINNTFDSDEQLANIEVAVSGAETATLTEADYTESGTGPYTYSAVYTATTDGDYTFTLNIAEDSAGNDGASSESTTVTVGGFSIVDHFDDGTIGTQWTQDVGVWSESGTEIVPTDASASEGAVITNGNVNVADTKVRTLSTTPASGNTASGPCGRYSRTSGEFYSASVGRYNGGILAIYYWSGTGFTKLASDDTITIDASTQYYVDFEASGTSLSAAVYKPGGTKITSVSATDSTLTSGYWGMRTAGTGHPFDTFEQ